MLFSVGGGEHVGFPVCGLFWNTVPNGVNYVLVIQTFVNSITTDQKVVEIVLQFECCDFWFTDNNIWVTSVTRLLCLDVTESSWHRQTAWENSEWALYVEVFFIWARSGFCEGLGAVNLSPTCLDPQPLLLVIRLVVPAKHCDLAPCVHAHDDSAVSDIDNVGSVVNDHNYCCTRTRAFRTDLLAGILVLGTLLSHLNQLDKISFAFSKAKLYGFLGVHRELIILNHKIMQIIPKVIRTSSSTVTIKNSKEADLGPLNIKLGLWFWLENVQDDANAVFVVLTDDSLVSVCGIGLDDTAFLLAGFCWLVIFKEERLWVEDWRVFTKEQLLNFDELDVRVFFYFRLSKGAFRIGLGNLSLVFCRSRLIFSAWVLLLVWQLARSGTLFVSIILAGVDNQTVRKWTQRFCRVSCRGVGETHHLAIPALGFLPLSLPHVACWSILRRLHRSSCELSSWWKQGVTNRSNSLGLTVSQICVLLDSCREETFRVTDVGLIRLLLLSLYLLEAVYFTEWPLAISKTIWTIGAVKVGCWAQRRSKDSAILKTIISLIFAILARL